MIIGTRFEFCLSDILLDKVDYDDIYAVIAQDLNLNDSRYMDTWWNIQIDPMAQHYSAGKNSLHLFSYDEVVSKILDLQTDNKLLRRDVGRPIGMLDILKSDGKVHWYQINLRELDMEPAVKLAWGHYKMLSGLCK